MGLNSSSSDLIHKARTCKFSQSQSYRPASQFLCHPCQNVGRVYLRCMAALNSASDDKGH